MDFLERTDSGLISTNLASQLKIPTPVFSFFLKDLSLRLTTCLFFFSVFFFFLPLSHLPEEEFFIQASEHVCGRILTETAVSDLSAITLSYVH